MKNKIMAALLAVEMVLGSPAAAAPPAFGVESDVIISNQEEFLSFAKSCTLDSWSRGKTVSLSCDIDFSDSAFMPIGSFGGTFFGNGHIISGVTLEEHGSYVGLFRYIQQGGRVADLNVKGKIAPIGSKSFIGGIAGENAGRVENCTFEGSVKGDNVVGGIVGHNVDSGRVIGCIMRGSVNGENSTGGIVGKNSGFVQGCNNEAAVNTVYEEKKNSLTELDTDGGALLENYKRAEEEHEEESVLGHSDTGGVVGYSDGVIQGCNNQAAVGYKHVGYNVGGIAGRQSGYMLGCQNFGLIQGRKDVGGIVGQAEPYVLLNASESTLRDLRTELNRLHTMVNRFITDADTLGEHMDKNLEGIAAYADAARQDTDVLLNQGTDFVDDNLDELNAQAAILDHTLDQLTPIFDSLESGNDDLTAALESVADAFDGLELTAPDIRDDVDDIAVAMTYMADAGSELKKASARISRAKTNLKQAIKTENQTAVNKALVDMTTAIDEAIAAHQSIKQAVEAVEKILKQKPESFEALGLQAKEAAEQLHAIGQHSLTVITSLQTIKQNLRTLSSNTKLDFSAFKLAAQNMEEAFRYLGDALYDLTHCLNNLSAGLQHMAGELSDFIDDATEELDEFNDKLTEGLEALSYAAEDIQTALGDMGDVLRDLSDEKTPEFVKLGDDFKTGSENLFDALAGISNEIDELRDSLSTDADRLSGDVSAVSNQFNLVMNLLIDEFETLTDGGRSLSDIFVDVSDEDVENAKQGKVADCHNLGAVEADRNTGGIAGAMAIEYTKDPEDDIEKPTTLDFTYRSRAVLEGCVNDGSVTGKKDCTGGVAGLSEIGTVYACENYGDIEGVGGNYIGGIVGKSGSAVRKSYAKAKITGKRYVGGVAGKANILTGSYAIVNVSGDESMGAVCGDSENRDMLYHNYFVDSGLGAVDGISYCEKAEPIDFEALRAVSGIPTRFISFSVRFVADDKTIETQVLQYGEPTARIRYPEIPEKDGYFGSWQAPVCETVTENLEIVCDYKPYITILAGDRKNENGKLALALAEGEFTDRAVLRVADSREEAPAHAHGDIQIYDISLLHTEVSQEDAVTLRILNENRDKVTAWVLEDDQWEKVKTTAKGKYSIISTTGTQNTICLQYSPKSFVWIWILGIAFIVLAAAGGVVFVKRKKKESIS